MTSLVLAQQGKRVLSVDADPQANLTTSIMKFNLINPAYLKC